MAGHDGGVVHRAGVLHAPAPASFTACKTFTSVIYSYILNTTMSRYNQSITITSGLHFIKATPSLAGSLKSKFLEILEQDILQARHPS